MTKQKIHPLIPKHLHTALKTEAASKEISINELLTEILRARYLSEIQKEVA